MFLHACHLLQKALHWTKSVHSLLLHLLLRPKMPSFSLILLRDQTEIWIFFLSALFLLLAPTLFSLTITQNFFPRQLGNLESIAVSNPSNPAALPPLPESGRLQQKRERMQRFSLWPGISKGKGKQKGTDGYSAEQRRGKVLAGQLQMHGVLCQAWEGFLQKGKQQAWLHHCHGNSQIAGWTDLETSSAWDYFQ